MKKIVNFFSFLLAFCVLLSACVLASSDVPDTSQGGNADQRAAG